MLPGPIPQAALGLLPFATAALDFHRAINACGASRSELDALHAHLVALHGLLDALAAYPSAVTRPQGDALRLAGVRVWQAADRIHAAYHVTPRQEPGESSTDKPPAVRPPGTAREPTICHRHRRATCLARLRSTPAELRAPFTKPIRF